jgi:hypothetical protein
VQSERRRSWAYALFLILVPLVPLWRAVFLGQAIGPFDQIRQMAPWNGPKPSQPWDVLPADGVLQFYGWRDLVFEAWHRGIMPVWNSYELAGTPLLANSQSAGFYPLHILFGVLGVPTALALTALAWFHLALAGLGVRQLAKSLGADELGAAIGGASFSLSTFMVAWTGLPSVITTVAWIPWAMAGVVSLYSDSPRPWRNQALTGGAIGMMFLAGHLQFAAYGVMAIVFLAVGFALIRRKVSGLGWSVGALVLGGLLSAIQLLPVLNYSQYSHRKNAPSAEGYAAYLGSAIQPFELATLSQPNANGTPRAWANDDPAVGVSSYWPSFVKQGANFAESAICLGPLVIALLLVSPWRKRELWVVGGIGLMAFLLAIGTPLNAALYFGVPGWSSTGSPGRVGVLFVMAACIVAALGIGEIERRREAAEGTATVRALVTALGGAMAFPLAALAFRSFSGMAAFPEGEVGNQVRAIADAATRSNAGNGILSLALVLVGLAFLVRSKSNFRGLVSIVPIGLAIVFGTQDVVMTGAPLDRLVNAGNRRIAVVNDPWGLTAAAPALLPPNTAMQSRIREIGGYDSLLHRDTVAMLNEVNGRDSAPPANGNMMFVKPGFNVKKLAEAGVQEVWSKEPLPILSQQSPITENGIVKTRIDGPGLVSMPGRTATVTRDELGQIDVEVQGSGHMTVRERAMPGWEARLGGKKVEVPEGRWIELDVPAGTSSVELRYTPPGLRNGLLLSVVGGLVFVVLLWLGWRGTKIAAGQVPTEIATAG